MANKCLLFTYDKFQPASAPPRSASQFWRDQIRGELYDLGGLLVAVRIGRSAELIDGFVAEIDVDELVDLDGLLDTESREFVRRTSTTEKGFEVYVYEYGRSIPEENVRVLPAKTVP